MQIARVKRSTAQRDADKTVSCIQDLNLSGSLHATATKIFKTTTISLAPAHYPSSEEEGRVIKLKENTQMPSKDRDTQK